VLHALGRLAVLEVEPDRAARRGGDVLARSVGEALAGSTSPSPAATTPDPASADGVGANPDPGAALPEVAEVVGPADRPSVAAVSSHAEVDARTAVDADPEAEPVVIPAATAWGGLLFLLPVMAELEVPDRIAADGRLTAEPLPAVLHALGTVLVDGAAVADDVLPEDPALLAFAGLAPHETAPVPIEAPEAVEELAGLLVAGLRRWLDGSPTAARTDAELLEQVLHRPATVEADPGWIDLWFDLDGLSIDVRRAGLDLDPGHVPWLGCVVRFRYA
jgi:hypothetical protein